MFGSLGFPEIMIIVFGILVLFGGKKLPEIARGLGSGIKELKNSMKEIEDDISLDELKKKK